MEPPNRSARGLRYFWFLLALGVLLIVSPLAESFGFKGLGLTVERTLGAQKKMRVPPKLSASGETINRTPSASRSQKYRRPRALRYGGSMLGDTGKVVARLIPPMPARRLRPWWTDSEC